MKFPKEFFEPNNKRLTFKIWDDNEKEVECEILFTYESDETGKNYVVYTDYTQDEGNTRVFASIYDPNDDEMKFFPIQTDKEWEMIEDILNELRNEAIQENN